MSGARDEEPFVRPRLGQITQSDGIEVSVMFEATEDPTRFRVVNADGEPVQLSRGDQLYVDVLGPGQGVRIETDGSWQPSP